jgi:chemotaxis protein methyltransferase WspC
MNTAAVEIWLQEHTGLDAATLGPGVVSRAVGERMTALHCANVADYLARLADSAEERHTLIERVVVPETWFFRDRPAFEALARHVVETWGPANPGAMLHLLSVPCSTGEEPYSLAIALARAGWPLSRVRIEAVDISREHLTRARAGVYGRNSFRGDDMAFRDAFFEPVERERWRLNDAVRAPVHFAHGNLLAADFGRERGPYHAIFCRNLLIYFDRPTQARAIRTLDRLLGPGGWIAVGPAEPILLFEHGYAPLKVRDAFLLERLPEPPGSRVPMLIAAPQRARSSHTQKPAAKPPPRPKSERPPARASAAPWATKFTQVQSLADAGQLAEAATLGDGLLACGATPELLYLLGVVADARGEAQRAEVFYRKALFLDPHHAEALVRLALQAEQRGEHEAAHTLRARAARAMTKKVG